MADEEHWAQRRQRAVRCKIHGLHYDPRLTSSCALCRKEGLATAPRQKPQLVLMLLSLLGVAVILYRIFGPGAVSAASDSRPAPAAPAEVTVGAAATARLDPAHYRASIEAVEQALFESPADSLPDIRDQIVFALRQLRSDLAAGLDNAAEAAAIDELANAVAADVFSLARLGGVRQEWARLRSRTFLSVPWFVAPGRIDGRTERAALVIYRDVASNLYSLLDEGADRAESLLTPPAPNTFDAEVQARSREEWRSYRTDWRQRIDDLRRELPPRPAASADPQVLLAAQRLEQAFARATSLAAAELPPEASFEGAFDAAERARQSFDELLLH